MIAAAAAGGSEGEVARHYDDLDSYYREIWGDELHHGLWLRGDETLAEARRQLTEFIIERVGIEPGLKVCDIGCGYGTTARHLAARGAQVTGITISPAQFAVAEAAAPSPENPRFILGDWLAWDLPAGSFDAAVAVECVEQLPDQPAFFQRAAQALRVGGKLVVTGWLAGEGITAEQRRKWLAPIARGARMARFQTASTYDRWAAEAGLAVTSFEDLSARTAPTWPAIVRVFATYLWHHPRRLRLLFDPRCHGPQFATTVIRLILAFRLGMLRYGAFTFVRAGA